MADEFIYFLVGGLAILAVLFVVFGFGTGFTGEAGRSGFDNVFVTSPIPVGEFAFDNVETLYVRFDADNYLQTNVYDLGPRRISNGLLFGNDEIKVDLGKSEQTVVSFDVARTNLYGNVIIRVDDAVAVNQRLDEGHYEFPLPAGRAVTIFAQSSEWRVWAPAVYELQNVRIAASVYPREATSYTFELARPEEVQSMRVDFSMDSNAGRLVVKLNSDVVYDGAVNGRQSIYLDSSKLDNLNILTFDAREDSKFDGRATIALTRRTLEDKVFDVDINMTSGEYSRFSGGTISFDVVDIMHSGGYSVTITNNGQELLREYVKLENGYFVLNLKRENLRPGLNIFTVRSADNAAFTIQGFTTRL